MSTAQADIAAEPLIQIEIQHNPDGEVEPSVPIRWCVTPHMKLVEVLKTKNVVDPHLLIVVRYPERRSVGRRGEQITVDWRDTKRYLVPLTAEMKYISFSRPGLNEVKVAVVDLNKADSGFYKRVETLSHGEYYHSVMKSWDNDQFDYDISEVEVIDLGVTIEVDIPQELFPAPPTGWRKVLADRFYPRTKPFDECGFRKMWLGAIPLTLLLLTIGQIVKLISVLLIPFFGLRKPAFKELLRPFYGSLFGVWEEAPDKTLFWFQDRSGHKYSFPRNLVTPYTPFIVPSAVWLFFQLHHDVGNGKHTRSIRLLDWNYWHTFLVVDGIILAVAIVVSLLVLGVTAFLDGLASLKHNPQRTQRRDAKKKVRQDQKEAHNRTRQENVLHELTAMSCDTAVHTVDIKTLPKHKQTARLRFAEIKNRRCRPYVR